MAKLTRPLHERVRGDHIENEDWWRLVFDTEAKRLYIEHEWSHADVWRAARSNNGTAEFDINAFPAEGEAPAQAELLRIIESLFEKGVGENA
jgi:GH35 family endo-1,4-beta-xylanase